MYSAERGVAASGLSIGCEIFAVERLVLQLLANGFQSKEIADAIGKKKPTVEGYIRTLYVKLNAKSRAQLVARAYAAGILHE